MGVGARRIPQWFKLVWRPFFERVSECSKMREKKAGKVVEPGFGVCVYRGPLVGWRSWERSSFLKVFFDLRGTSCSPLCIHWDSAMICRVRFEVLS
jgi:hypothetical protein